MWGSVFRFRGSGLLWGGLGACWVSGCISGSAGADYPLYPKSEGKLGRERVARLVGYVQVVDGRDVSGLGGGFLLLPGCHTVLTPTDWGKGDPNTGAVTARTGHVPFVLPMHGGRQYLIEVATGLMTGPTGSLSIKAYERGADGKTLAEYGPVRSEQDVQSCQERMDGEKAAAAAP